MEGDTTDLQSWDHLPFLLAVQQIVEVLHRDERRELIIDRVVLHRLKLIGVAARHPNVADVASLDDIMEGLHCLFNRSFRIETMALEHVYVV